MCLKFKEFFVVEQTLDGGMPAYEVLETRTRSKDADDTGGDTRQNVGLISTYMFRYQSRQFLMGFDVVLPELLMSSS